MKQILIAIAFLAVTVLPSYADDTKAQDMKEAKMQMMKHHPEMMKEMMRNPHHLLMMAYHNNVMTFGHKLKMVAKQGETVPRDFARTAVAEMKRSVEEMERHRAEAMRNMPADVKGHADMKKMMDQHLVTVKTHLRELETLAGKDRVPSAEVIKHLEFMQQCEGMECEMMHGKGMQGAMPGKGMKGDMYHGKGMRGCCECMGDESDEMQMRDTK